MWFRPRIHSGDYLAKMSQNELALRMACCASVASIIALAASGGIAFALAEHLDTHTPTHDFASSSEDESDAIVWSFFSSFRALTS